MNAMKPAQEQLDEARATIERWQTAITETQAARQELANDAPGTPDDLDTYTQRVTNLEARHKAAQHGLEAARKVELAALRTVVEADLTDTRKKLTAARKDATTHGKAVEKILAELRELDGADYGPSIPDRDGKGGTWSYRESRLKMKRQAVAQLESEVETLEAILNTDGVDLPYPYDARVHTFAPHVREWLHTARERKLGIA